MMDMKKKIILLSIHQILNEDCAIPYTILCIANVDIRLKMNEIFMEMMDSELQYFRQKMPRVVLNIESFLNDFSIHFRMNRITFESLLQIVGPTITTDRKEIISVTTQLLVTLWILATPDSFRSVGKRFSLSNGTVHYIYVKAIRIISQLKIDFIKWPSENEINNIKNRIARKWKFPNVVGCIDGMHVNIKAPKEAVRYYNRKKTTSLILQGVCNDQLQLTDVYFGEVGSLHDSRVFSRSPLSEKLRSDPMRYLGYNGHLLGDSAYPLKVYLMTPFKDNGHLTDEENVYNFKHSIVRSTVERSFALLKGKWRRLKYLDACVFEYIVEHVMSCCVLHNFVLHHEKININEVELVPETTEIEDCDTGADMDHTTNESIQKRNDIASLLYDLEYCQ